LCDLPVPVGFLSQVLFFPLLTTEGCANRPIPTPDALNSMVRTAVMTHLSRLSRGVNRCLTHLAMNFGNRAR
ncbi:hypothetical protein F5148DRAFT_1233420, partial [Russula earlei]